MTKAAELAKMGEVLTNSQIGGRRNIIINGAMQIAQRGTSATNVGSTTSGFHTLDRFKHFSDGGSAGRLTMSQSTVSDLPGFVNALKLDCTTADTSIAASEYFILSHPLEGQDLQQLKKGTSSAEKVTLSFYVKGNASATYSLELNDGSRRIGQTFSVTTSWNRVVLTFDGDTSGAIDDDNTVGLYVNFWLHAGTTFTGGTHGTSWATLADNERAGNSTSIFDSTDRTLEITGLQMEVGSQATPFEHRSFGEELDLCHRYYEITGWSYVLGGRYNQDTGVPTATWFYKKDMRANPTISNTGTWTSGGGWGGAPLPIAISDSHVSVYSTTHISASNNIWFNGGSLIQDAEL